MTQNSSERKARDAVHEAEERLHEGRREFFKLMGLGAAAATGAGSSLYSSAALAYGGPYASAFALDPSRLYMNIGTTGSTPLKVLKNHAANYAAVARDP